MNEARIKELVGDEMFARLSPEAIQYILKTSETFKGEFGPEDVAMIIKETYGH